MNSDEGITIIYFSIYIFCSQRHNYFIFTFYHNFTNSNLLWIQLPAQDPAGLLDKSIFIYHGLLPKKNSMRVHFCMTILPGSGDQVYIYIYILCKSPAGSCASYCIHRRSLPSKFANKDMAIK